VTSGSNDVEILLNGKDGAFGHKVPYATGNSPESIATTGGPWSVATSDFDGDGYPDLAMANGEDATVSLLLAQCQ
jgi:hypothetical protein